MSRPRVRKVFNPNQPTLKADQIHVFGTIYNFTFTFWENRLTSGEKEEPEVALYEVCRVAVNPETAFLTLRSLHEKLAMFVAMGGVVPSTALPAGEPDVRRLIADVEAFLRNPREPS
jgi:hypothetical protein